MNQNDIRKVATRWFEEVWNNKNENSIDELLSASCIGNGLPPDEHGNPMSGPEGFKPFFRKFIASFPDLNVKVLDTIVEGNKVAALCHVKMTHSGEDFTIGPGLPAIVAKKPVVRIELTGMTFSKVEDGKIQEAWNCWDFLSMHLQLGSVKLA